LHDAANVFPIEEMERGETDVGHFLFAKNEALRPTGGMHAERKAMKSMNSRAAAGQMTEHSRSGANSFVGFMRPTCGQGRRNSCVLASIDLAAGDTRAVTKNLAYRLQQTSEKILFSVLDRRQERAAERRATESNEASRSVSRRHCYVLAQQRVCFLRHRVRQPFWTRNIAISDIWLLI
jgi:hypothetical protein